ncbi:MAG TPA: nucleoside monophosphate kinase [Candidatus Paceibacterota bacterium]|nr:nucleoside monophosphate kinase [Candidatus Paceibacterota bacterium]
MEPITVAFFGISGSGKGTQANLLKDYLNKNDPTHDVSHAEMGNFLRQYWEENTLISGRVKEIMLAGGLVPSFVAIYMLARYFDTTIKGDEHFIFDGTCRRIEQSVAVDEISRFYGRKDLHVISLNLSKDAARQRLVTRGRSDDASEEALNTRFQWYNDNVIPSMEKLRELGWHIHVIEGEPDVDTIHKNILTALQLT